MRRAAALLCLVAASSAIAQATNKERIFGSGKPPVFKEEDLDRRFLKSKIYRALTQNTPDANCKQLIGGLLGALASTGPLLHRRDDTFFLDPGINAALQQQLSTQAFPGVAFLASMVRRVEIDGKLPDAWVATAEALQNERTIDDRRMPIDLARLHFLAQQVRTLDSYLYTLPTLLSLFDLEVRRAPSVSANAAEMQFRDTYLDRDVAWGGLTLLDISQERRAPPKHGKGAAPPEASAFVAHLSWSPPDPHRSQLMIFAKKMANPDTQVVARLAEPQFLSLSQQVRGKRMMVRGRLWETSKTMSEMEIRDAYLFDDPDTSQGAFLAEPQAVAMCPLAVNDLAGLAPIQPGGFGQH